MTATGRPDLRSAVEAAIDRVFDPCSIGVGTPLTLRELGLLSDLEIRDDGDVSVRLCLTALVCQMAPHMVEAVRAEVEGTPGVRSVHVEIDHAVLWTSERMSPEGRRKRDLRLHPRSGTAAAGAPPRDRRRAASHPTGRGSV